jgi:hypothetical protein
MLPQGSRCQLTIPSCLSDSKCNCKGTECNCLTASLHQGVGEDAASPRVEELACNITSKTSSGYSQAALHSPCPWLRSGYSQAALHSPCPWLRSGYSQAALHSPCPWLRSGYSQAALHSRITPAQTFVEDSHVAVIGCARWVGATWPPDE